MASCWIWNWGLQRKINESPHSGDAYVSIYLAKNATTYRERTAVRIDAVGQKSNVRRVKVIGRNCRYNGSDCRRLQYRKLPSDAKLRVHQNNIAATKNNYSDLCNIVDAFNVAKYIDCKHRSWKNERVIK